MIKPNSATVYEKLPSIEKEAIDRKVNAMTEEVERHQESRVKGAMADLQAAGRDVANHCYRHIVNGGYFIMPSVVGGNEFKEEPMSEEDKQAEKIVRLIKYDLTVDESIELIKKIKKEGANVKE